MQIIMESKPTTDTPATPPAENKPAPQAMDVVAAPAPAPEAPAEAAPEAAEAPAEAAKPKVPPAPKEHDNTVTMAVISTAIVVIVLAALATFAYMKSSK
jgi:hypothetical protein